jgi:hypothetical protein
VEKWLQEAWELMGYSVEAGHTRDKPKKYTDMSNTFTGNVDINKGGQQGIKCDHEWYTTGRSPIHDTEWENCKHCDIAREDA